MNLGRIGDSSFYSHAPAQQPLDAVARMIRDTNQRLSRTVFVITPASHAASESQKIVLRP